MRDAVDRITRNRPAARREVHSNLVRAPGDQHASHQGIPVMLGESPAAVQERLRRGEPTWRNPSEKRGKRVWYAPSIGNEPLIADVILERVNELAPLNRSPR